MLAVLTSAFHGRRLLRRGKRILLPEVHAAARQYGLDLRTGEATDPGEEAAAVEPSDDFMATLGCARLPQSVLRPTGDDDEAESDAPEAAYESSRNLGVSNKDAARNKDVAMKAV